MEHYRIKLGVRSPVIDNLQDYPRLRIIQVKSAKLSRKVKRTYLKSVHNRIQSAPISELFYPFILTYAVIYYNVKLFLI